MSCEKGNKGAFLLKKRETEEGFLLVCAALRNSSSPGVGVLLEGFGTVYCPSIYQSRTNRSGMTCSDSDVLPDRMDYVI